MTLLLYREKLGEMLSKFYGLSTRRQGEVFQLASLGLWALWPILTVWASASLHGAWQASLATLFAVPVFAVVLTLQGRWHELYIREAWLPMLISSILIGVGFYGLAFTAYQHTTAGNGALISLVEVLYSAFFFGIVLGRERYTNSAYVGTGLALLGGCLVLFQGSLQPNLGDLILLGAYLFAPVGNFFQQQARQYVSSATIMFVRSVLGGIFLAFLAYVLAGPFYISALSVDVFVIVVLNGLLLLGLSKIFWLESIHRISVVHAQSIAILGPGLTLMLAFLLLDETPTWWQIVGFVPMLAGAWLVLNKDFMEKEPHHTK